MDDEARLFAKFSMALALLTACSSRAPQASARSTDPGIRVGAATAAKEIPSALDIPKIILPPDSMPPAADLVSEVPGFEAKLLSDQAYAAVWDPRSRTDLDQLLTVLSQLIVAGEMLTDTSRAREKNKLKSAAVNLFLIHCRTGKLPDAFTSNLAAYGAEIRDQPNLGVWTLQVKGSPPRDFSALMAWMNRTDPRYLREVIKARHAGSLYWTSRTKKALLPYLAYENEALERLALLGPLTKDEGERLAYLKLPKAGDRLQLGQFAYVVDTAEARRRIGNQFASREASEGAVFLLVRYTIESLASETRTVLADDFRIVDSRGRQFSPSADANTALVMAGRGKDLVLAQLQPGLKRRMITAFEVPEEVASSFRLVIPEKGALGTGGIEVALSIE